MRRVLQAVQNLKISLRSRIILLSAGIALTAAILIVSVYSSKVKEIALEEAEHTLRAETAIVSSQISNSLTQIKTDVELLFSTPPIKGVMRARDAGGIDPLDGSTELIWRERLATIFEGMIAQRPAYTQLRYIEFGNGGAELVRVNQSEDGRITRAAIEDLQKKGLESYMQEAQTRTPSMVYFSAVSLNREHGAIHSTSAPTLRVLIPIQKPTGGQFGVLVINTNYKKLLTDAFADAHPKFTTHVIDESGDFLTWDHRQSSFSFTLAKDLPASLHKPWREERAHKPQTLYKRGDTFHYKRQLNPAGTKIFPQIDILVNAPDNELLAGVHAAQRQAILLIIIMASGCAGFAALAAEKLTRPLRDMIGALKAFEPGKTGLYLPTERVDEIGGVSRAFENLVDRLDHETTKTLNIINSTVDGLIVINESGIIENYNPACERILGYKKHEVMGKNLKMLLPEGHSQAHDGYMLKYINGAAPGIIGKGRELEARHKDGSLIPIGLSISEFWQGDKRFFCGVVRDLSQTIRQRREMAEATERLEMALDAGDLGMWDWEVKKDTVKFSDRYLSMIGYEKGELKESSDTWPSLVKKSDLKVALPDTMKLAKGELTSASVEFRMRHKNGSWVWVQSKGKVVAWDENGKPSRIVGTHLDINEKKRAEVEAERQNEKIAEANDRLELTLEGGGLGQWDWDIPSKRVIFCERWAKMVGYKKEDLEPHFDTWEKLTEPGDYKRVTEVLKRYLAGKKDVFAVEFRMRHKQGHWVWIQARGKIFERAPDGTPTRMVGTHLDITARKQIELETQEQNAHLAMAETVANLGHWSYDFDTQELYWSDGMYAIYGVQPGSYAPDTYSALQFFPSDNKEIVDQLFDAQHNDHIKYEHDIRLKRPNGEMRYVRSKGEVLIENGSKVIFGIIQDITQQKQDEARLATSEEKNRTVLENIVDGVLSMDENGVIDSCNSSCAEIFGYDVDDLVGKPLTMLMPEEYRAGLKADLQHHRDTGEATFLGHAMERKGLKKDGTVFDMELAANYSNVGGRSLYTGILRDITERKQMERMKSEFISTVNHELRTPLTSISGSLDMARKLMEKNEDKRLNRLVDLAHTGCQRLSSLVNDILDQEKIAAGKMDYRMEVLELDPIVQDIIDRHEGLEDRFNIKFKRELSTSGCIVRVDPSRFNQAVVNLLSNAGKFSPDGDTVTISTQVNEDGGVRISVSDNGPGIPADFQKKIFQRFAQADGSSTRKVEGTGLGLNITKSIIEAFDGQVSFDTEEGVGTTFHFDLPQCAQSDADDLEGGKLCQAS